MSKLNLIDQKLKGKNQIKIDDPEFFIWAHHKLMTVYGWIPLEEYGELSFPTIINLLDMIQKDEKEQTKPIPKK